MEIFLSWQSLCWPLDSSFVPVLAVFGLSRLTGFSSMFDLTFRRPWNEWNVRTPSTCNISQNCWGPKIQLFCLFRNASDRRKPGEIAEPTWHIRTKIKRFSSIWYLGWRSGQLSFYFFLSLTVLWLHPFECIIRNVSSASLFIYLDHYFAIVSKGIWELWMKSIMQEPGIPI